MLKNKYDYIVYGASVKGIVKSISLKNEGNSVLLLNKFGFTGGAITESLRLLIDKNYLHNFDDSLESKIYNKIFDENYSILGETDYEYVLNPEVVKIILLQFIKEYELEHLFHVVPSYITNNQVELIAKEGLLVFKFKNFIDESDEKLLNQLMNKEEKNVKRFYNIIVTKPQNLSFLKFDKIEKSVELKDGRYFLSLELKEKNEIEANHKAQFLADELSDYLEKSGNRIQLLPTKIDELVKE
jgi:hypothetical protein